MKNRLLFLFLVCLLAPISSFAQSVRTFVSTDGIDNAQCGKTTPCRTFTAAIAVVNPAGEVVALEDGGYGPVTINKNISLVAPAGVHAAIAPTTGAAITVNPGSAANVVIRGLFLNSQGATIGIQMNSGHLTVSDLFINGFTHHGIRMSGTSSERLSVRNVDIRMGFDPTAVNPGGITVAAGGSRVDIRGSRFLNGYSGVWVQDGKVAVTDSVAAGNNYGFVAFNNQGGVARLSLINCDSIGNTQVGLYTLGDGLLYVADSRIFGNLAAINTSPAEAAKVKSLGNNTFEENTDNSVVDIGSYTAH